MTTALWIIAVCEIIRMLQNMFQIMLYKRDAKGKDNLYSEFIDSLNDTNREWAHKMLMEYEREQEEA